MCYKSKDNINNEVLYTVKFFKNNYSKNNSDDYIDHVKGQFCNKSKQNQV